MLGEAADEDEFQTLVSLLRQVHHDQEARSVTDALGRLINDDTLYIQLTQTIRAANRSLEDLRETTPITTFANLLFQAFQ